MNQLISNFSRVIFIALALQSSHLWAKSLELIPVEELMRSSSVYSMKLSPNGQYIFSYEHMQNYNIVSLIDPKKRVSVPMFRMDRNGHSRVEDYQWVDDKTIYLEMKAKKGFIKIVEDGEQVSGEWMPLGTKGFMVSTLPDEDNIVLFARNVTKKIKYPKFKLYKITPEQLASSNYEQAIEIENTLDGAFYYIYNEPNQSLMAAVLDDETLEFWFQIPSTKEWKKYYELGKENQFIPIGLLNENTIAVLTNKNLDRISLVEFDLESKSLGQVIYQHPNYDLTGAKLNKMGEGVNFVTYLEQGIPNNHYFAKEKETLTNNLKQSFKTQQVSIIDSSADERQKLISAFSSTNPGSFYYYETDTNKATLIARKQKNLSTSMLSPTIVFQVEVEPNVYVEALLTVPLEHSNGVLLVNPHGGPIGIRDLATYDPTTQYFANRGYAVLKVNFRGSSGYGKDFMDEGRGEFGKLIEHDISAAVKHVKSKHNFTKMCSIGSSYGGYSAMMLAIKNPNDYDCIVAMYGIYDLPHLYNANNRVYTDEHQEALDKVIGGYNDSLKGVSPIYLANEIKAPVLLIAGKKDKVAYFEQSNRMKYRLKQLNKELETIFYNNVGHGYHDKWGGDRHQIVYIEDFIRRKLELPYPTAKNDMQIKAQERRRISKGWDTDPIEEKADQEKPIDEVSSNSKEPDIEESEESDIKDNAESP
ncbi:alpha/beta hydrolase family protein [Thalassotalea crassostreae]|uniref:alpha/beta hydrolase family protein n=1 Tax=Thalassotalea crassostreae TaxID=1763536 RepID=UPI0008399AE1|nr:prolyl oligopeptidase family serine peptidase [Thalassotalea crassostreae]